MELIIFKILSLLLTLICFISGIITFVSNPGIVYNQINENINSENNIYCSHCKFKYPDLGQTLTHCFECGVCYIGRDHHCNVFGKCVAKKNLNIFSTFSLSICFLLMGNFASMGYIMISIKN